MKPHSILPVAALFLASLSCPPAMADVQLGNSSGAVTRPVAVWNPETSREHARFRIEAAYAKSCAGWLQEAKIDAKLLTAAELADSSAFNADGYDALFLQGGVIPDNALTSILAFVEQGGIIVMPNGPNFLEIKIAQDANGLWEPSPTQPNFAWQTPVFDEALGVRFNTAMDFAFAGVEHTVEPLLARYLPETAPKRVGRPIIARNYLPLEGTDFFPLVRSRTAGGATVTPQVFLVVHGVRRAIHCSSGLWTAAPDFDMNAAIGGQFRSAAFRPGDDGAEAAEWPCGRDMVVAFARLARDLRSGAVIPDPASRVQPIDEAPVREVLATRGAIDLRGPDAPGANPEGIRPYARWGAFNGSRQELGPGLSNATSVVGAPLPAFLHNASAVLAAPADLPKDRPSVLRVRCARTKDVPGRLRVATHDGTCLWDEELVMRDAGKRYADAPLEVTRLVLVPAGGGNLVLSCPGDATLYLDAVQWEPYDSMTSPQYELGLHTSVSLAYDGKTHGLTPEICKDWSLLRCTTRTWWVGEPGSEDQWTRYDNHVERYLALHLGCQFILEGTPEWAAISADRWARGGKKPHMCAPDPAKFDPLTERIVGKYADRVKDWEIGNETTVWGFWNGTAGEYAEHFKRSSAIVRRLDPDARVIVAGMAGVTRDAVDPFILAMSRSGALTPERADLFGVRCYAPNGMWDMPHGLAQGHLYALGESIEIFANEQGNTVQGAGEAGSQGAGLEAQARNNDRGTARLFASGLTKLVNFQSDSGMGANSYGILDPKGKPRPAYASFQDYLRLARDCGRRVPVALAPAEVDAPLHGVYAAAARHADGSFTLILNPADVEDFQPAPPPPGDIIAKAGRGKWVTFFGKVQWTDTSATVTSEFASGPKEKAGFFRKIVLDPSVHSEIEVSVPSVEGAWMLMVKGAGQSVEVFPMGAGTGVFRAHFGKQLGLKGPQELEISFRVKGKATFDAVRFPAPDAAALPTPDPVRAIAMLPVGDGDWILDALGEAKATLSVRDGTATLSASLTKRTVFHLSRKP